MGKIVSINQPAYLPWLGYFDRISNSNIHIVLDHVQFEKNSFTNRNKIRIKEGSCWLTIPVKTKGKFGDLAINTLEIANAPNWSRKHIESIKINYKKAPFFDVYFSPIEDVLKLEWAHLSKLLEKLTLLTMEFLSLKTTILYSSKMNVSGTKSDLVLNLCKAAGADTYLSGALGKNYLDEKKFEENQIKVLYQDYKHPSYAQVFPNFEPYMAAIDLLFNCGPQSLEVLKNSSYV